MGKREIEHTEGTEGKYRKKKGREIIKSNTRKDRKRINKALT